jgi:hypothetical protein
LNTRKSNKNLLLALAGQKREDFASDAYRTLTPAEIAGALAIASRSSILRRIDLP